MYFASYFEKLILVQLPANIQLLKHFSFCELLCARMCVCARVCWCTFCQFCAVTYTGVPVFIVHTCTPIWRVRAAGDIDLPSRVVLTDMLADAPVSCRNEDTAPVSCSNEDTAPVSCINEDTAPVSFINEDTAPECWHPTGKRIRPPTELLYYNHKDVLYIAVTFTRGSSD